MKNYIFIAIGFILFAAIILRADTIPPGDITNVLQNLKPGQIIELQDGATYVLTQTISPPANVKIHCSGQAKLSAKASPGASTNFSLHQPGFIIDGVLVTRADVFIRAYAPFTVTNTEIQYAITGIQTDVGGVGKITYSRVDATDKVGIYDVAGSVIDHCYVGPSTAEYSFRKEVGADGKRTQCTLTNSRFTNPYGPTNQSKAAVGIRNGDAIIDACAIDGYIRIGQDAGLPPNVKPGDISIVNMSNTTITETSMAIQAMPIYQGAAVTLHGVIVDAAYGIIVGQNSSLLCVDCVHYSTLVPRKPLVLAASQGQVTQIRTVEK